jgi:hypothetical protein
MSEPLEQIAARLCLVLDAVLEAQGDWDEAIAKAEAGEVYDVDLTLYCDPDEAWTACVLRDAEWVCTLNRRGRRWSFYRQKAEAWLEGQLKVAGAWALLLEALDLADRVEMDPVDLQSCKAARNAWWLLEREQPECFRFARALLGLIDAPLVDAAQWEELRPLAGALLAPLFPERERQVDLTLYDACGYAVHMGHTTPFALRAVAELERGWLASPWANEGHLVCARCGRSGALEEQMVRAIFGDRGCACGREGGL